MRNPMLGGTVGLCARQTKQLEYAVDRAKENALCHGKPTRRWMQSALARTATMSVKCLIGESLYSVDMPTIRRALKYALDHSFSDVLSPYEMRCVIEGAKRIAAPNAAMHHAAENRGCVIIYRKHHAALRKLAAIAATST